MPAAAAKGFAGTAGGAGGGAGIGLLAMAAKVAKAANSWGCWNICMDPEVAKLASKFCSAAEVGGIGPFSAFSGLAVTLGMGGEEGDFRSDDSAAKWMACSAASRAAAWIASRLGLTDLAAVSRSSGDLRTDK